MIKMDEDDEDPGGRKVMDIKLENGNRRLALQNRWKTCLTCKHCDYENNGSTVAYIDRCPTQDNGLYSLKIKCRGWGRRT